MTAVGTWNVGNRPDGSVLHGLEHLAKRADVLGLQECGDRRIVLDRFCREHDWRMWLGDGSPGAPSVPILWNPRTVRRHSAGTRDATPATHVGAKGAGPSKMKAKVWNRVTFIADGERFVVINGHIVPSVYLPSRRRLAREQIDVLADMVERRLDHVDNGLGIVAVGDFNMRATNPLTKPLRAHGMTQRTKHATHGRRCIDHVWTLRCDGKTTVLPMPSDHNAVLFEMKEK